MRRMTPTDLHRSGNFPVQTKPFNLHNMLRLLRRRTGGARSSKGGERRGQGGGGEHGGDDGDGGDGGRFVGMDWRCLAPISTWIR